MLDLNTIVVISLGILAFFSLIVVIILVPLALQFSRTLSSIQNLLDIINYDVTPTFRDVKQSVSGVKNALRKSSLVFQSSVDEAGILVVSATHGLFTGVKEYFAGCKTKENEYNSNGHLHM